MRFAFWKNKSFTEKSRTYNPVPLLVEDDQSSFSDRIEGLSHINNLIENNTFIIPLLSYELFSKEGFNIKFSDKLKMRDIMSSLEMNIYIQQILKNDILKNLRNLHKECEEEGFQKFLEIARENAKQILNFIYSRFPNYNYHIYPTEDREVAINCTLQKGKGILVLCDSNGGIACFATFEGKNHRFRYDNIDSFSYRLLYETFENLDVEKKHSSTSFSTEKVDIEKKYPLTFSIDAPVALNQT